jgi:transposase
MPNNNNIKSDKYNNAMLSAAIVHALKTKENFQLYAYHIVSPHTFSERTMENNRIFDDAIRIIQKEESQKSQKKSTPTAQLDLVDEIELTQKPQN